MDEKIEEWQLYLPIKAYFEQLGYQVNGEVKTVDVTAEKDGELIALELKTSFSLRLVYQVIDRQQIGDLVFAVIPRPKKSQREASFRNMTRLLKRLDAGLITVALDSPMKTVEVVLTPSLRPVKQNTAKRKALLAELEGRGWDGNQGGVNRKKLLTAYREKALQVACYVAQNRQVTPKQMRQEGMEDKMVSILTANFYRWFEKPERGVYQLSPAGKDALENPQWSDIVQYYLKQYERDFHDASAE